MSKETEYGYEKIMREEKLTLDELPEDAKVGIASIKSMQNGINVLAKKGKKPRTDTVAKIKAFDKWIVREILDYVEGKDTNTEAPPVVATEVVADLTAQASAPPVEKVETPAKPNEPSTDPKGVAIEEELKGLLQSNKHEYTIEELKAVAPKSYDQIFQTYDTSGDNGIETSNYKIIETSEKVFTISSN